MNTLDQLEAALDATDESVHEIHVAPDVIEKAQVSLQRMLTVV